jgi:5'-nucleotidase
MAEDKALARCSGVDLIIGGHEHTLLESMAGHAPIFKMTADAREMGRIDLNIDKQTGKLESIDWKVIPVTDEYPDDPSFAAIHAKYGGLLKDLGKRVGRTTVELEMKSENVRTRETNMGNFIADAYRQATGADVALVNGGSIRADALIKPGPLTKRDVLSILPFNNKVLKIQITGATLRAALEHGVGSIGVESQPGRFPQVSGMRFSYDASRKPGERVTSVTVNGRPLVDRQMYTLAATSYVIKDGGDGYTMFRDARVLGQPDQTPSESEIMQRVITLRRPIAPKVEGRITRIDTPQSQTTCKP